MAAALGVACGLAAWWVVGIGAVLAFVLLVGLVRLERALSLRRRPGEPD
jgi:hypothetical protein